MHFTELSGLMAVLWSSLFILLIYFIRKKGRINRLSEVLCLVFLYLFSVMRMIISIDFIPSIGIDLPGIPSEIYEAVCMTERNLGEFSFTILQLFCLLWIVVALIKLLKYYKQYRKVIQWTRTFRKYEKIDSVIDKVQNTIGKKIKIDIKRGTGISSPIGIGIFYKIIVLPDKEIDSEELYYILLHECTHFYNHDLAVKMLIRIYICCFWWNPFVYLLKKDLDRNLEIKCDLRAVNHMSMDEVERYLKTIIKILKESEDEKPNEYAGIVALAGKKENELTERFQIIIDNQHRKGSVIRTVVYALTFALLFVLSYSFMPMTYFEPQGEEIEVENDDMEFDLEDAYLYRQKNGEYRLIKNGEFNIPLEEDKLEFFMSQGFEIKEEK